MQPRRNIRVLTVSALIIALFLSSHLFAPASAVRGQQLQKTTPVTYLKALHNPNSRQPDHVALTLSPPATPTATPDTIAPVKDQSTILATMSQLIQTKPWIPLGGLLVILLSALIYILGSAQQKARKQAPEIIDAGKTAPLAPSPELIQDHAYLQLKNKPDMIFPLVLTDIRIGRAADNTLVITTDSPGAETVSGYHARIYRSEKWILEDLDSTNGVYINGVRTGRNYLRDGWEIGIGGVIFVFHSGGIEF
ncbi:MAG: FHA domain-containing protein [Anaerolineae bacterium]|nr:FHA domain-containing protein [Anaerolineae bacterium]